MRLSQRLRRWPLPEFLDSHFEIYYVDSYFLFPTFKTYKHYFLVSFSGYIFDLLAWNLQVPIDYDTTKQHIETNRKNPISNACVSLTQDTPYLLKKRMVAMVRISQLFSLQQTLTPGKMFCMCSKKRTLVVGVFVRMSLPPFRWEMLTIYNHTKYIIFYHTFVQIYDVNTYRKGNDPWVKTRRKEE